MSGSEPIWEYHHHWSSFLPNANSVSFDLESLISTDIVTHPQMPVLLQYTNFEGNVWNITKRNLIDISVKPRTTKHVHVGQNWSMEETENFRALFKELCDIFSWTYKEIPGINPSIFIHDIKTYPIARSIRQKLWQVYPRKAVDIKSKVEKLLKTRFIYLVPWQNGYLTLSL